MCQHTLLSLPLDIIHLIIESIDEPADLLRLALTSKPLHHLITSDPSHLQYRFIQCAWNQPKLWSLFKQNAHAASRVQKLLLLDLPSSRSRKDIPPLSPTLMAVDSPATQEDSDIMACFKEALTNMVNLTEFLRETTGFPGFVDMSGNKVLELCLDIALYYRDVRELDINPFNVILKINPSLSFSRRSYTPKVSLNNLTRIYVMFNCYVPDGDPISLDGPIAERLVEVIMNRCPNLEDLSLKTEPVPYRPYLSALAIFAEGHWPNLQRLTLYGNVLCLPEDTDPDVNSAVLNAFWKRHPNLECLLLRIHQEHKLDIQSGVLVPKLKSLSGFLNPAFSAVAVNVLPRIQHMCDYTTDLPAPRFPISYFKHTTSLTSLILMELDEDWEQLLLNHPTITRFALCRGLMPINLSLDYEYKQGLSNLKTLASLPSLTHLYLKELCFREPAEYLSRMSQFPKLEYIYGIQLNNYWNILERDDEGRVTGWHRAEETLIASLESFEDWGCDLHAAVGYY